MFEGFQRRLIETSGARINLVVGGSGSPVLLLHGYPQTHMMWHRVAPRLARQHTVVAADLRGYGDSSKPESAADHSTYSKRAMAEDVAEVMSALGHKQFAVVGHDRGARVAYRMAFAHPERVTKLAVLDVVPTHFIYANANRLVATAYYHWFMLIQPKPLPERLIGADPEFFLRTSMERWSGSGLGSFDEAAIAEYIRCFSDPATIHATCEDYRAGASIDFEQDAAEHGMRKIRCPTLALYSKRLEVWRPLDIWREWADDVSGGAVDCGHFLPEEAPDKTYEALSAFL
jgi:haloacetate dehalogenase